MAKLGASQLTNRSCRKGRQQSEEQVAPTMVIISAFDQGEGLIRIENWAKLVPELVVLIAIEN